VTLKTTCIKNVKFDIIKIRASCQYIGILLLQRKRKLGRKKTSTGLDIAGLNTWCRLTHFLHTSSAVQHICN